MDAPPAKDAFHADEGNENHDGSAGDGGVCPSEADAANGNGPGLVVAMGGANGASVDCTFCGVIVTLATSAGYSFPTLYVSSGSKMTCSTPGDASDVWMGGTLVVDAAKPGIYQGSPSSFVESNNCDQLMLSYHLPSDGGTIDCGDSGPFQGPPSCPTGCFSECADAGDAGEICTPCQPGQSQPLTEFDLRNGCGTAMPGDGSWTVTLTSVAPAEIPPDSGVVPGMQFYVVHGSLDATLLQGGSGPSVTVTLTF